MEFYDQSYVSLEEESILRIGRARTLCVQLVDLATKTGKINDYNVTLNNCTCGDFKARSQPCKHMYRLAYELGLCSLYGPIVHVPYQSICIRKIKKMLKEVLNFEERKLLFEIANAAPYKSCTKVDKDNKDIIKLFDYDLVYEDFNAYNIGKTLTKKEMINFFAMKNIIISPKMKKDEIITEVIPRYSLDELSDIFQIYFVVPHEKIVPHLESIRKFLYNEYYYEYRSKEED